MNAVQIEDGQGCGVGTGFGTDNTGNPSNGK